MLSTMVTHRKYQVIKMQITVYCCDLLLTLDATVELPVRYQPSLILTIYMLFFLMFFFFFRGTKQMLKQSQVMILDICKVMKVDLA